VKTHHISKAGSVFFLWVESIYEYVTKTKPQIDQIRLLLEASRATAEHTLVTKVSQ